MRTRPRRMSVKTRGTYFYPSKELERERERESRRTREIKKREKEKERQRECNGLVAQRAARYICVDASIFTWRAIGDERKRERENGSVVHHRRMKNLAFPDEKRYL